MDTGKRPQDDDTQEVADECRCDTCSGECECSSEGTATEVDSDSLQREIAELRETNLRLQADFDNYRRRMERDRETIGLFANESLIKALLPAIDNFDRALSAIRDENDPVASGVLLVRKQLVAALERAGLTAIEAVGKPFDPNMHEAVGYVESEEYPDDTVVDEFQKGYLLGGRLLRAAMVRLAKN